MWENFSIHSMFLRMLISKQPKHFRGNCPSDSRGVKMSIHIDVLQIIICHDLEFSWQIWHDKNFQHPSNKRWENAVHEFAPGDVHWWEGRRTSCSPHRGLFQIKETVERKMSRKMSLHLRQKKTLLSSAIHLCLGDRGNFCLAGRHWALILHHATHSNTA